MKQSIKRLLLVIAGIFVIAAGFGLVYSLPMLLMHPTETGQISGTNIYAVKNQMGTVYFIKTDNGYIMVDAGSKPEKFLSSINDAGIDTNDIKWVFLTHSDFDHVAGLTFFTNAAVHMNEDEMAMIDGTVKRSPTGGNKMPEGFDIRKINLLPDGKALLCGGTSVICIKTPGHTTGSMSYLVDGKYLFTGDAFKLNNGKTGIHPFTINKELAQKTIEQITETTGSNTVVFTSHYGYYKGKL